MDAMILGAVGLGGLYAIANQEKKKPKKPFYNDKKYAQNDYMNNKDATGKYMIQKDFQQDLKKINEINNQYAEQINQHKAVSPEQQLKSKTDTLLSGQPLDKNNFKHNNMVPFFGGKIRGAGPDLNQSEAILDNMIGTGNLQINNTEQAPLFRPEENVQWAYGQPVNSDFYQSRVNPSMTANNVKPWEEIHVAPGLNKGFTAEGSGGFNAGMESRNDWLPKTVNELRVDTNPKETFGLLNHEGPANSYIKNSGILGDVDKNRPDTYFINSPERYLTTTGLEKAQTARGIEELKYQNRVDAQMSYEGIAGSQMHTAPKAPENYHGPRHPHTFGEQLGLPNTAQYAKPTTDGDFGRLGHKVLANNRSTTEQRVGYGGIGGVLNAIIAPLADALRPTRKENVIGNIRLSGNVQKSGGGGEYVYNPNDVTKTTIREMTEDSPFHLNVQRQKKNAYLLAQDKPSDTQRMTTNCEAYGTANGTYEGIALEDAYRRQRNNNNKVTGPASIHGNMQMFNGDINMSLNNNKMQCNNRAPIASGNPSAAPAKEQYGMMNSGPQIYNECKVGCDRIAPDILDAFKKNPYTQSLSSY